MSSGVAVSDECKSHFEDVKKGKKFRYVVYYIKDEKTIQVESLGDRDAKYADFLRDLQKKERMNAGMGCMILSMSTSAKEPPSPARSRSSSSCPGALIVPRSRRRCCTLRHLMPSRSLWSGCTSTFRPPT